jgi:hypothetical protein
LVDELADDSVISSAAYLVVPSVEHSVVQLAGLKDYVQAEEKV